MSRLLLVDCDGTIREPMSGKIFIENPFDQKIIEGADTALSWYQDKGWEIVGVSNQGGVAAGHKSLEDAIREQKYTLELFPQVDSILICPDFKGEYCWWIQSGEATFAVHLDAGYGTSNSGKGLNGLYRKPNPGMLIAAMRMFGHPEQGKRI